MRLQAHGQGQVLQPPAAIGQPVLGQPVYPQPPLPDAASSKGSNSMQPHSNAITNGMPVEQPVSGQAWLNGPLPKSVRAPPPSRPAESDVGQASHAWVRQLHLITLSLLHPVFLSCTFISNVVSHPPFLLMLCRSYSHSCKQFLIKK